MELAVKKLDGKSAGAKVNLSDEVFGLEPRLDIISRVVRWQETNIRVGSSNTKNRSDIRGGGKKPFSQKGTGNARQGSLNGPHQTGGGVAHGPLTRNISASLPKKVRKLGVCHALSLKIKEGNLFVLDNFSVEKASTKLGKDILANNKLDNVLFIGGREESENLRLSINNIHKANFLPDIAVNVRSLLSYDAVVIAKDSVAKIEENLVRG